MPRPFPFSMIRDTPHEELSRRVASSRRGSSPASLAKSGSIPPHALSTPPMPPTTARCLSASCCRAVSRTSKPPSPPAANWARRSCPRRRHQPLRAMLQCRRGARLFEATCGRILSLDPEARLALASSPASCSIACAKRPRSTTSPSRPIPPRTRRCTLGGMIGNNSCGIHALMGGKTVDNIRVARRAALRRHAHDRRRHQ